MTTLERVTTALADRYCVERELGAAAPRRDPKVVVMLNVMRSVNRTLSR